MWFALLICLGGSRSLSLAETQLELATEAKLSGGFDSNATKAMGEKGKVADALLRGIAGVQASAVQTGSAFLRGSAQVGSNKYFKTEDKDSIISQGGISVGYDPGSFDLTLSGNGRLKREAAHTEDSSAFGLVVDVGRHSQVFGLQQRTKAGISLQQFAFDADDLYSFKAVRLEAGADLEVQEGLQADMGYHYSLRGFLDREPGFEVRMDTQHDVTFGIQWSGMVLAAAQLMLQKTASTIKALSNKGGMVTARAGIPLPWQSILSLHGAFQVRTYAKDTFLVQEGVRQLATDEEENLNAISVMLSRRLLPWLALDLQYRRFSNELSDKELAFDRTMVLVGLQGIY